jgi:hypothetical protein
MSYNIYFKLPNISAPILLHKAINRIYIFVFKKFFLKNFENQVIKSRLHDTIGINTENRDFLIEVSLTSFPARINEVSCTIETIFCQTVKPDIINLWLSIDQFPDKKIPELLELQKKRGLTIFFVDDDLRSHKKYYYAFKNQTNNLVITFDDDVYYPTNTIESLISAHKHFPNYIICNRGHKIIIKNNTITNYKCWNHNFNSNKPSYLAVPTGVGGVLYPPNSYHQDIFDIHTFKRICFFADDLWLKIHTLRKKTKVLSLRTYPRDFINVGQSQNFKLVQHNALEGGNDLQLQNLLKHYDLTANDFQDEA